MSKQETHRTCGMDHIEQTHAKLLRRNEEFAGSVLCTLKEEVMSLLICDYEWNVNRLEQESQRDRIARKFIGSDWVFASELRRNLFRHRRGERRQTDEYKST